LAPHDRPARTSRNRLAGPADCRSLRTAAGRRARGYVCSKDRPFARPLFLRHEGRLAAAERCGERGPCRARRTRVRNRRHLFAVASHRRQGSRHRRDERFAHVVVRHSSRAMGRRSARPARRAQIRPAGRSRLVGCLRRNRSGSVRRRDPDLRHCRRSAGCANRPGLLQTGHDQVHLRHRLLCADQHRRKAGRIEEQAAHDHRLSARRQTHLRAGGLHLRRRRRRAVAARQHASGATCGRHRPTRRSRRSDPGGVSGAGLRRPRCALLAPGRAWRAVRPDARNWAARIGASRTRKRLLSDRRPSDGYEC